MLMSIFSLLSASLFAVMDAADVALTEAAIGAGISTLLMLRTLALTDRYQSVSSSRPMLALPIVIVTGALLVYGTWDMPPFGAADAPAHHHVGAYYLEHSMAQTGVPNVVTSVLASYRGYDTFGELVVIFTAGIGVLGLLAVTSHDHYRVDSGIVPMQEHDILRIVSKVLMPLILVFALYVQFHGEYSPGGGFQAGVIFAASVILYSMLFGQELAQRVIDRGLIHVLAAIGVLLYTGVGFVSLFAGMNFLNYYALAETPTTGQVAGIILVELGVGITVAAMMMLIFFSFSDRENIQRVES